jgi:uncharacterized phiE125 gp8 family phage protein
MKPVLITPPASEPVTLGDVKKHLRVFFADDDTYLEALVKAAIAHLDGYGGILNRCIMSQAWQTTHCRFSRRMETIFTDTTAVVVKYYDADGAEQTIDAANYKVYSDYIRFNDGFAFPNVNRDRDDPILLISTHGYAEDLVPETLVLAIKILVAHWYRNREPVTFGGIPSKILFAVDALIAPHRWAF